MPAAAPDAHPLPATSAARRTLTAGATARGPRTGPNGGMLRPVALRCPEPAPSVGLIDRGGAGRVAPAPGGSAGGTRGAAYRTRTPDAWKWEAGRTSDPRREPGPINLQR